MSIFAKNLQKLYLDKCRILIKGAIFLRDKTDSYTIFFRSIYEYNITKYWSNFLLNPHHKF